MKVKGSSALGKKFESRGFFSIEVAKFHAPIIILMFM